MFNSFSIHIDVTDETVLDESGDEDEEKHKDERVTQKAGEKRVACDEEFSDSDEEGEARRHIESHKRKKVKIYIPDKEHKGDINRLKLYSNEYIFIEKN